MKLTAFLMIVSCLHLGATGVSQTITFSGKEVSLEKVFRAIEQQTGFFVVYNYQLVRNTKPVTISAKNVPLETFIQQVLKEQSIDYSIRNKTIFIRPKNAAAPVGAPGHQPGKSFQLSPIDVKGKITNEKGEPVAGATVSVKGKNKATVTNEAGLFNMTGVEDGAILIVSSVGYESAEIKINGKADITVQMKISAKGLSAVEVTVNTGYQQIRPERFVGSATIIDSTILERQVSRDLLDRLDGTASGLLFNKSTGSSVSFDRFHIRGFSTMTAVEDLNKMPGTNPLIILDDFPFTGDIGTLNPNDIESVTILKDAAASSIWGARAGNGVIVIKSKKGRYNKSLDISFNSNITVRDKPDLTYFPQMSGSEFIDIEKFLFDKGFYNTYLNSPQYYTVTPVVEILDKKRKGLITEADADAQINALRSIDVRDDFDKYVYRRAINKQNYLRIAAGSGQINYNLSIGADNNLTSIRGHGSNDRYTINSNINLKPAKFIELTVGINYANEKNVADGPVAYPITPGGKSQLYPYAKLADENGNHLAIPYTYRMSFIDTLARSKLLDWHYRPLDEKDLKDHTSVRKLIRLNAGISVKLTPWLTADVKYQLTTQNENTRELKNIETFSTRDLINRFTNPVTFKRAIPLGGILELQSAELSGHNLRGQLNINKNWQGKHDFTALIAGEIAKNRLTSNRFKLYGYDDEVAAYATNIDHATRHPLFFGSTLPIPNNPLLNDRRNNFVSVLANASYTYDARYAIYISGRRDGSNLLGVKTNNKYKPLWSIGGRWNISEEGFYHIQWMPVLTWRASYGYAGNTNNSISALSTIRYNSFRNRYGQSAALIMDPPNPDLRWEEVGTLNIGIDFSLFNNRITGSFEWYRKKSTDVIAAFPVDPTLGISSSNIDKNAAHLDGKGVDISLHTKNFEGHFKWQTGLNFSYTRTIVSKFFRNFEITPLGSGIREGDIYGAMYAYKWAGLDPQNGDPRGFLGKEISKDYQAIFSDKFENQAYKGSPSPLFFGNMMNTFSYAGISLSANISFRAAYYSRKPAIRYDNLYRNWESRGDFSSRWKKPGDELITNVPAMPYPFNSNRDQFYEFSEINIDRADNIRFQDIRLSYDWSNRNYKIPVKRIQLYMVVGNMNLILWKASTSGYDPDYSTNIIPPVRSYSFGLNVHL